MTKDDAVPVTAEDREAAKQLLDLLRIREHETGSFRSWDDTVQAFARHRGSTAGVEVEKIETVTGDFGTEPGEPFWRVRIGEQCADFDFELAARNFAAAIERLASLSQTPATPMVQEGLREALELARPIVEADLLDAIDHCDADWEGMSRTALEAIDRALSATPAPPVDETERLASDAGEVE